jgi:hypothetical protein
LIVSQKKSTETSGFDSGIFRYRNFVEVPNQYEVSVERKWGKFLKFRAKKFEKQNVA